MEQQQTADRQVRLEKFRLLHQTLPQSIPFGCMLALVAVVMLWRYEHALLLTGWLAAHVLLSAWRLGVLRRFGRQQDSRTTEFEAAPAIQLGCIASGVLWGLLALFPYPPQDIQVPLFIAFTLAGVTAGGANAMASELVAALVFQLAIFAPFAARLLFIETDATYHGMGVSACLYTLFMALWTRRMHLNAVAGIRQRLASNERERQLQQRESRYRDLAHHDALTGLPNRLSLHARMPELLEQAAAGSKRLAIVYIDLDHFKDINDSRGHRCGDALLASAAARLRECVRTEDLIVRMGGDEFVIVTVDSQQTEHIDQLALRLAASIELPLLHDGEVLETSASMGVAVYPDHGTDAEQLLKNADLALYQAKAAGRGNHKLFAPEMSVAFRERIFLEQALVRAIGTDQLYLEYQPLIDLASGRLTGLEALLRWQHPERGLVSPLTFIPIAEHCGLIDTIGTEVLRMVCRQLREWQRSGVPPLPVAINVSPTQFERGTLVDLLLEATSEHQIPPTLLQIEITETALMKGTGHEESTLQRLRQLGVKVLIDDFGIGFSSLNHLKNLAIDGLKIDRSFVRDMIDDERDAAIVAAIVGIAKNLNIDVLAEGVESSRHVEHLIGLGCRGGQGHFLHEPIIADRCSALLLHAATSGAVIARRSA
jgi:diguanylate cyclase (GGDEF)-like protein